jgi:tetratricopeptide (TPR) repeat protein
VSGSDEIGATAGAGRTGAPAQELGAGAGLAGSLERIAFPLLLRRLHAERVSGVLHLSAGRKRKWIQLREGRPTAVRSNLVSECLGNLLVRTGRIKSEALEESRRLMDEGDGMLQGEILVAIDALSEAEVSRALREQAEEKFLEVFAWREGEFRFEPGSLLQKGNGLGAEPLSLVLCGIRTRMSLARIDAELGLRDACRVVRNTNPPCELEEAGLEPEDVEWLEALDDTRLLGDLVPRDEVGRRMLFGLVVSGFVELHGGEVALEHCDEPAEAEGDLAGELAVLRDRLASRSHFEVFGVSESSDEEEIRAAYERLRDRSDPARLGHCGEELRSLAAEVFASVEAAWQVLADRQRRLEYAVELRRAGRQEDERDAGRRALEAGERFEAGEAALRQRDYRTAAEQFQQAVELNPDDGEYHAHLGWALHCIHPESAKQAEVAIRHLKRGIKLAGDREKPYLFMGRVCKAIGRDVAAEKMFHRAARIQPECLEALRELRLMEMRRRKEKGLLSRLLGR